MRRAAICAALLLCGCGGPPSAARAAVAVSADAVVQIDHAFAERYTTQAAAALSASATAAEYAHAMAGYDTALHALRVASSAVLTSESALDAWEAGSDDGRGFLAAAGCVAVALGHLSDALVAIGVVPPDALRDAVDLVRSLGRVVCSE